ncbi:MAG: helix-turn-helix transcriptional regulator [Clostridia bacterium]|nr:helix-turn-helix transcriptional regulator [Clostridia bacterium]
MAENSFKTIKLKMEIEIARLVSIFRRELAVSYPNDEKSINGSFDFWTFIFIESGTAVITTLGNKYIINKGEIVFTEPGQAFSITPFENGNASFISVSFYPKSSDLNFFKNKIIAINNFEHENLYYALKCSHRLYEGYRVKNGVSYMQEKASDQQPFGSEQMLKLHIELLLLSLRQRGIGESKEYRINSFAKQTRQKSITQQIQHYLEEHITENLTLEQIAKDNGFSISQLQKSFKAEIGESIIDYFIGIKIERAKLMISEGNLTFTEIARRLGYVNPNYFSRLFKRRVGITATQYSNL